MSWRGMYDGFRPIRGQEQDGRADDVGENTRARQGAAPACRERRRRGRWCGWDGTAADAEEMVARRVDACHSLSLRCMYGAGSNFRIRLSKRRYAGLVIAIRVEYASETRI